MIGLYLLFIYAGGITLLGVIVLTLAPSLRFTFTNLLVFVVGAVAGMLAMANLFIWGVRLIFGLLQIRTSQTTDVLIYFPAVIGAALGGAALVWLKTRIMGRRSVRPM